MVQTKPISSISRLGCNFTQVRILPESSVERSIRGRERGLYRSMWARIFYLNVKGPSRLILLCSSITIPGVTIVSLYFYQQTFDSIHLFNMVKIDGKIV